MVSARLVKVLLGLGMFLALIGGLFFAKNLLWVKVIVNLKDPRSTVLAINKMALVARINLILNTRQRGVWIKGMDGQTSLIYPKLIGIFLTDKIRLDNPGMKAGRKIFGSAISKENEQIAILYIWAEDEVYAGDNPAQAIAEYIYQTIGYYQDNAKN
jgi:hypothetical protein